MVLNEELSKKNNIKKRSVIYSSLKYVVQNSQQLNSKKSFNSVFPKKSYTNSNIAISFSGGKDSFLSIYKALEEGFNISFLFHVIDKSKGISITAPYNTEIIRKQAETLGFKLIKLMFL